MNRPYLLPRDAQQEKVITYCDLCGGELYEDEEAYYDDGSGVYICSGCLEQWAKQNLSTVRIGDQYES